MQLGDFLIQLAIKIAYRLLPVPYLQAETVVQLVQATLNLGDVGAKRLDALIHGGRRVPCARGDRNGAHRAASEALPATSATRTLWLRRKKGSQRASRPSRTMPTTPQRSPC